MSGEVTFILPCAGAGSRFGAPYPKELHCVAPGLSAVDLALAPVVDLAARGVRVRVVAVLTPAKLATAEHLRRYADRLRLTFTYQTDRHGTGIAGALAAAAPWCGRRAMVVLPDQSFDWSPVDNPLLEAALLLETGDWAVLAATVDDPAALRAEGALKLARTGSGLRVAAAAEKPADPAGFDAAWVVVGCAGAALGRLPAVFDRQASSPLVGAAALLVDGYRNLTSPDQNGLPRAVPAGVPQRQ